MTDKRDLKKLIRARQAVTGERYTTARANLLAKRDRNPPRLRAYTPEAAYLRLLEEQLADATFSDVMTVLEQCPPEHEALAFSKAEAIVQRMSVMDRDVVLNLDFSKDPSPRVVEDNNRWRKTHPSRLHLQIYEMPWWGLLQRLRIGGFNKGLNPKADFDHIVEVVADGAPSFAPYDRLIQDCVDRMPHLEHIICYGHTRRPELTPTGWRWERYGGDGAHLVRVD